MKKIFPKALFIVIFFMLCVFATTKQVLADGCPGLTADAKSKITISATPVDGQPNNFQINGSILNQDGAACGTDATDTRQLGITFTNTTNIQLKYNCSVPIQSDGNFHQQCTINTAGNYTVGLFLDSEHQTKDNDARINNGNATVAIGVTQNKTYSCKDPVSNQDADKCPDTCKAAADPAEPTYGQRCGGAAAKGCVVPAKDTIPPCKDNADRDFGVQECSSDKGTGYSCINQKETVCTAKNEYFCTFGVENTPIPPPQPPPCSNFINGRCQKVTTAIGDIVTDPLSFIKNIFTIILSLSGGIAMLLIISAGYRFLTSQGNQEAVQGARETLTSAIVGLLFIIFSFVILRIIGVTILKLPGFQ